jgi:hypothetical protein
MADQNSTPAEVQAWIAASNIARFQRELDSETDMFRYNILVALLAREYEIFEKQPLP